MPHTILPGPHPAIVQLVLTGTLEMHDVTVDDALGLNTGTRYLLVDATDLSTEVPAHFMEMLKKGFLPNRNLAHVAVFSPTGFNMTLANMIIKLIRLGGRISFFKTHDEALGHLISLVHRQGGGAQP
jgi:hypothetical protein